jgi:hypothetical protein
LSCNYAISNSYSMLSLSQVLMRGTSPKITMESTGLSCYFCGGSLWVM